MGDASQLGRVPAASLANGLSGWQDLVAGEARHERSEGVHSSHMDLSHPPERTPGGVVANQRSGGRSGKFSVWLGRA